MVTNKSKAEVLAEYYAENGWRTQPFTITYLEDAEFISLPQLPSTSPASRCLPHILVNHHRAFFTKLKTFQTSLNDFVCHMLSPGDVCDILSF